MLAPFTVLLASAVVVSAGSSSASASTTASAASSSAFSSSPYIPTDISSTCSTYLATLDTDSTLTGCTSALLNATSAFAPSASSTTQSNSTIASALDTLCSTSITAVCPQSLLTGKLANFQTACNAELVTNPNSEVKTIYDTFYALLPLHSAVCAKDSSGAYCTTTAANASALADTTVATGLTTAATSIRRRGVTTAYLPDAAAIAASNVMFLGLSANATKTDLCTSCTRSVLTAYLEFESGTNYAPGLAQSVLMGGQSELYAGVLSTCGSDFLTSTVQAAGGLGTSGTGGLSGSGAVEIKAGAFAATLVGAVVAIFML